MPLLETSFEVGMSGPGRLHDLFVTHEAMSPGDYKTRGAGLTIRYGFHIQSPFGVALVMVTDRGLAGLAFSDAGDERACLCRHVLPLAERHLCRGHEATGFLMPRASSTRPLDAGPAAARRHDRHRLPGACLGKPAQDPDGQGLHLFSDRQRIGSPTACRAVGAAVGANPLSFVVPCHRALGKSGALTGYHWG
jgi:AraC family transcriptional regulator of adaptative response/methylated-DNA-[protein]-cysteine methyltransferase